MRLELHSCLLYDAERHLLVIAEFRLFLIELYVFVCMNALVCKRYI